MATAKVRVTVPNNVTFAVDLGAGDTKVYSAGDEFELEREDAEQYLRAGNLVEVRRKRS